jgi:hypothetical protein
MSETTCNHYLSYWDGNDHENWLLDSDDDGDFTYYHAGGQVTIFSFALSAVSILRHSPRR